MKKTKKIPTSIDAYIKDFPEEVQTKLKQIREIIKSVVPEAEETISYAMPTFDLNGKHLVHFAGYKKHIGFYPTPSGTEEFKKEISNYAFLKGTIRFPLDKPIPIGLVKKIVKFRVSEVTGR